ncbi:flagellar hook-basal body complex protein [bacterium]|nr:flagellar hook-basal body complex protein [bacterium]
MLKLFNTGVSGIKAHQTWLDVLGNNVANVNTYGFKKDRVVFADVLYDNMRHGQAPQGGRGGLNPGQIGNGVKVSSIDHLMNQGNLKETGRTLDLAVNGKGYFILNDGKSEQEYYTRAGNFALDLDGTMVSGSNGYKLLGWQTHIDKVTGDYSVDTSELITSVHIEKEMVLPAVATRNINLKGNLNANNPKAIDDIMIESNGYVSTAPVTSSPATFINTEGSFGSVNTAGFDSYVDSGAVVIVNNAKFVVGDYCSPQQLMDAINNSAAADVTIQYDDTTDRFIVASDTKGKTIKLAQSSVSNYTLMNGAIVSYNDGGYFLNEASLRPDSGISTQDHVKIKFTHLLDPWNQDLFQQEEANYYRWEVIEKLTGKGILTEKTSGSAVALSASAGPGASGSIRINKETFQIADYTTVEDLMTAINASTDAGVTMTYDSSSQRYTIKTDERGAGLTIYQTTGAGETNGFFERIGINTGLISTPTRGIMKLNSLGQVIDNFVDTEYDKVTDYLNCDDNDGRGNDNNIFDSPNEIPVARAGDTTNDDWYYTTFQNGHGKDYMRVDLGGRSVDMFIPNGYYGPEAIEFTPNKDYLANTGPYTSQSLGNLNPLVGNYSAPIFTSPNDASVAAVLKNSADYQYRTAIEYKVSEVVYDSEGIAYTLPFNFEQLDTKKWGWYVRNPIEPNLIAAYGIAYFDADGNYDKNNSKVFGSPSDPMMQPVIEGKVDTANGFEGIYFDPPSTPYPTDNGGSPSHEHGPNALKIRINFDNLFEFASAENDTTIYYQDGRAMGILNDIEVADNGMIMGQFSNGYAVGLAQIPLACFGNEEGLKKIGDTMFINTPNSGFSKRGAPGADDKGTIASGYLEMSNVDLSEEFTSMILAQRGFQANTRNVTTADAILMELMRLRG